MLVAQVTQPPQTLLGNTAHATLALNGLDQDGCRLGANTGFECGVITKANLIKAGRRLAEAFEIFLVTASGNGCQRAAVKSALECYDAPALWIARHEMIAPRRLDGAFASFRT